MKKIAALILTVILLLASTGCGGGRSTLTEAQKLEDFEYMWRIIAENYPFLEVNKRMHGVDWLANKEEYRQRVLESGTDDEFAQQMHAVLGELNNLHTGFLSGEPYEDSLNLYQSLGFQYQPWAEVLNQPQVLERYGPALQTEQEEGDSGENNDTAGNAAPTAAAEAQPENVTTSILVPEQTAYLGIRSFANNYVEQDAPVIRSFLQNVLDYPTLIIDIRGNGGGSDDYWARNIVPLLIEHSLQTSNYLLYRAGAYADKFLEARGTSHYWEPIKRLADQHLPELPPESLTMFSHFVVSNNRIDPVSESAFKGNIYLLVDEQVYSAAEGFASFAKSTGFATLVGERTGGDGLGMDPLVAALPNSGYVFRFSLEMGLMGDGSCNEEVKTVPDLEADPDTSGPLREQPAVRKVLELAASH